MKEIMMKFNPKKKEYSVTEGEAVEAWERLPGLDNVAEDIKASRKSGDTDDPMDVLFYDPLAIRMARLFIRLGWSANAVTLLSLFFGVLGSVFFYPQNRWLNLVGIVLEIFAAILDCCDGQVARLTKTSSQFGRFLDGMVDTVNFLSVYLVLGFRIMRETIPFTGVPWGFYIWILLFVTMLCHAG